jgi:tetratricopeptide (TPR) repeat protein
MRIATLLLLLGVPALAGDNDLEKATRIEKAKKAAAANPNDIDGWLKLADVLWAEDEFADAWEALEGAIAKNPKDARLSLKLGDTFVKLAEQEKTGGNDGTTIVNYYLDAERNYSEAFKKDPKCAAALCAMASVNFETGREGAKERAQELVAQCLGIDANYAKAHALQGYMLYLDARGLKGQDAAQKYLAAEEKYALALKLGDDDVLDMVRYGHTLLAQKDKLEQAKQAYLEALKKHPESNVPIGSGLYHVANRGEAKPSWVNPKLKEMLEEAVKLAPKSAYAWYYLGFCRDNAGATKEALDCYEKALGVEPKNATYLFQVGYMHEKLGDGKKALDFYRKALDAQPDQPQATEKFYGLAFAKASDMDEAEKLFDELIKLSPGTSYVLNDYALLLRDWCEQTGKHQQDSPPAEVKRRLKRSGEVYEMAAKAAPDNPQILSDTGLLFWYYPSNFDSDKAKGYLKRSLDLSDYSYLDAWNGLDKLCRKISDWETLADYAERVVGAMERGVVPTSPVGGRAPEPRPNEKAGMQARADAALKLAQEKQKKS